MGVDTAFSRQMVEACHSITILLPFKVPNNNVIWGGENSHCDHADIQIDNLGRS